MRSPSELFARARPLLATLAALALLAALPLTVEATIVRPLTQDQLAVTADVIVHARVVSHESTWNEAQTRIYTFTTLEVLTPIAGPAAAGEHIKVRQIGGTVGDISQTVVGNAVLGPAEEMVLFLDRDEEAGWHYVVGMAQGKLRVVQRDGAAWVGGGPGGDTLHAEPHRPATAAGAAPATLVRPVDGEPVKSVKPTVSQQALQRHGPIRLSPGVPARSPDVAAEVRPPVAQTQRPLAEVIQSIHAARAKSRAD